MTSRIITENLPGNVHESASYINKCGVAKHLFSRYKLRGEYITWCFNADPGWLRIKNFVIRWSYVKHRTTS